MIRVHRIKTILFEKSYLFHISYPSRHIALVGGSSHPALFFVENTEIYHVFVPYPIKQPRSFVSDRENLMCRKQTHPLCREIYGGKLMGCDCTQSLRYQLGS